MMMMMMMTIWQYYGTTVEWGGGRDTKNIHAFEGGGVQKYSVHLTVEFLTSQNISPPHQP